MFDLTLTFDNGPTAATPRVLDVLGEYDIKATFFVVGRQMEDPALRRIAEGAASEGHWMGNHTYSHSRALGEFDDLDASLDEISRTQTLIGALAHPDRLFRPYANGGVLDPRVLNVRAVEYLQAEQFTMVLWNALPRDWESADWPRLALEQCGLRPWSLMVLHDAHNRALPGLERFLPAARAAGARFRQEFPPDCTPLRRGVLAAPLDALVAR